MKTHRPGWSAATTALMLLLVGCSGDTTNAGAQITAEAQQILDDARQDVEIWYGSLADRHAAEIVVAGRLGATYEACMVDAGHPDADWRDTVAGSLWREPVVRSPWLVTPSAEILSADLYALQSNALLSGSAGIDHSSDAARECHSTNTDERRNRAGLLTLRTPAALADVDDDFTVTMHTAMHPFGTPAEFAECVEALEAEALEGEHLEHVLGEHAHERVATALVSDEEAAGFRAWELEVNAALWECSGPTFEEAVRLLPDVVAAHSDRHSDEIVELAEHWEAVRAEAAELWNA